MLNKKTLFNVAYAIGLVGAFMTCVGFLNEFLSVAQLYGVGVVNLMTFKGDKFWASFWFYLLSFLVATATVMLLTLRLTNILKCDPRVVNLCAVAACVILLILSYTFPFTVRYYMEYSEKWGMGYYAYMNYYTLRTGVMQFIGNMAIILVCHLIEWRAGKTPAVQATEETTDEA